MTYALINSLTRKHEAGAKEVGGCTGSSRGRHGAPTRLALLAGLEEGSSPCSYCPPPMSAVDAYPDELQRTAARVLALYLKPTWWLRRRTDVTVLHDFHRVGWTSTLQVAVEFGRLREIGLWKGRGDNVLLPLLLEERQLLTGLEVIDHSGQRVSTLTWEQTRPLIELMLLGTAEEALRAAGQQPPVTLLVKALCHFSGDVDEVDLARRCLDGWGDPRSSGACHEQTIALFRDSTMRLLLRDYQNGFIVMAQPTLRPDGSCELSIRHDAPIRESLLRLPVSSCSDYQCEVRLPAGAVFKAVPHLKIREPEPQHEAALEDIQFEAKKSVQLGRKRAIRPVLGHEKSLEAWAEVEGPLLGGFAPRQPRGTIWVLNIRRSVRNAPDGLVGSTVRITMATTAMFVLGVVARVARIRPFDTATAAILAAFLGAYAALVLQGASSPTISLVTRGPRRALTFVAGLTLLGAGTLAVRIPGVPPVVDGLGWGWRAAIWTCLAAVSLVIAVFVAIYAHRKW